MLDKARHPIVIDFVAGRDRSRSRSLCGASPELPLSRQWPHRAGMAPWSCPPTQNPACRFPAPGSPGRTHDQSPSDGRMTSFRVRQLEPRATQEVAPVQPVTLAASAQHSDPLQLNLASDVVEFRLAVMQSEVLVEATQHRRQVTLLVPSLPVPMLREPLLGARQKRATALPAWETNHRKRAAAVRSAYVRETQEVERLGSLDVRRRLLGGKASEEQQPCFVVGQLQVESREPLPQISVEALRVPLVLEARHKIIGKTNQIRLAPEPVPHFLLEPQVEHKVQVHVREQWAERAALRRARLGADDDAVLHDAGPEPSRNQPQDDAVGNAMRHHPSQPLVINVSEVSADVGLVEVPHLFGDQRGPQGPQRVVRAATRPKSVRAVQKVRLEHRLDDPRDRTLNQSVFDRRNAQGPRPNLARSFRNVHPPDGWRPIGSGLQPCANSLDSRLQLALELPFRFPIHSACPAPVHLSPRFEEKRGREQMRQRREAQRAVCLGLGRNLFQLCGHPVPTSERRGCVPGPAPRPAPPLPPVRGFPARRVLPADPTSTTASAFLWMVHSVGLLESPPKTVVDLPGSVALPSPPVPCSQTPPESPAPSPFPGAYWCLPSIRPCRPPDDRLTRLNRFTCVTARTSLCLRLAHVVTSMRPRLDSRWGGSFPLPGRELHPL